MSLTGLGFIGLRLSLVRFGLGLERNQFGLVGYGLKPFDVLWAINCGYNPVLCMGSLPSTAPQPTRRPSSPSPPPARPPVSSPSPSLPCATASPSPSGAAPSLGQKIQHELPRAGPPIVAAAPPRPLGLRSPGRLRRATFPPSAADRSCSSRGKPARCSGRIAGKVPLLVPSSSATTTAATRNATSRTRISGSSWMVSTSATRAPSRRSRVRKPS
ncbi:vegetative cell wall protein gp1 [Triticum aestivum]|uniref:vegetative cell wall protein gp1 n=1 Tax=Triticum aestivum TaxID=4565 RepID=UPI001D020F10|nr:vegetative cell wall protein gp1-like [Triticum aestivum]